MLKSMTAFGRAVVTNSIGRFTVEIQSVNRKHLEINIFIPREFTRFEAQIRRWIGQTVARGQVTISISAAFETKAPVSVVPNIPLAQELKKAWKHLTQELDIQDQYKSGLALLLVKEKDHVFSYEDALEDEKIFLELIKSGVDNALDPFLKMKLKEGEILQHDMAIRLNTMGNIIEKIAEKASLTSNRYRDKLLQKIGEVIQGSHEMDERIIKEVAIFADRIDTTEELVRFRSHLKQAEGLLNGTESSVGKTFEFIVQELNREINTIGSKSNDVEISQQVIAIKGELERIREQIQNVE